MQFFKTTRFFTLLSLLTLGLKTAPLQAQFSQGPNDAQVFSNSFISGSSSLWNNPDNGQSSDNQYALLAAGLGNSGDFSSYFYANHFQFSIPVGSVITGIKVEVERSALNGDAVDARVRLLKNGVVQTTDYSSPDLWPDADGNQVYGGPGDLWGNTWTVADVNNTHFGFALSIRRTGTGPQPVIARIDEVRITVYYEGNVLAAQTPVFTAAQSGNGVQLDWTSAEETGTEIWNVQSSTDGVNISEIGTLASAGSGSHNYTFLHETPSAGVNYYRLQIVNTNGEQTYTEWTSVNVAHESRFAAFPNPVSGGNFSLVLPAAPSSDIRLMSATGALVRTWSADQVSGLSVDGLPAGVYFVQMEAAGAQHSTRLVIQ